VLIPRFVNIYGPEDLNFNRIIPATIKSVLTNKNPEMWGGDVIREYLYIDDAIEAYIRLLQINPLEQSGNNIFNFGSGAKLSVRELVQEIIKLSGRKLTIKKSSQVRILEIKKQYVSSEKAKTLLGWRANVSLEQGITQSLAWYTRYFAK
jgi:CDP-glucose 4,6-dehydratase